MKRLWLVLAGVFALACGSDDAGGAGSGGAAGSASGGAAGAGSGGAAGSGGGAAGASGGAAGGSSLCTATENPFPAVDCKLACQHFDGWTAGSACANPYAGSPDCVLGCDTVKDSMPYTNALFGCAAQESDCAAFQQCLHTHCG